MQRQCLKISSNRLLLTIIAQRHLTDKPAIPAVVLHLYLGNPALLTYRSYGPMLVITAWRLT